MAQLDHIRHLLIKNIEWKSEGMRPVEDCLLPINVLAINVPVEEFDEQELIEYLGELLQETYGFLLYGFTTQLINLDGIRYEGVDAGETKKMPYRSAIPWPKLCDAVLDAHSL